MKFQNPKKKEGEDSSAKVLSSDRRENKTRFSGVICSIFTLIIFGTTLTEEKIKLVLVV